MKLVHGLAELRERLAGEREAAFVPTMGNLHQGHLDLVRQARSTGHPVVVSIFVNPLQFGPGEDYGRYPRTLEADCDLLGPLGTDLVFAPDAAEVYPEPQTVRVCPPLADELCGACRPGHFQGVATVVLKLFHMVAPRYAAFGKKDYQQLFIIKAMVRQLNLPITILEGETVRAPDGLALSSRNGFLSPEQRREAPRLHALLQKAAQRLRSGERDLQVVEAEARGELARHGWRVDYVSVRSQASLLLPQPGEEGLVILAAAHLGGTRLIDNLELCCSAQQGL
jgi:pantoate--beta-alanine ligase